MHLIVTMDVATGSAMDLAIYPSWSEWMMDDDIWLPLQPWPSISRWMALAIHSPLEPLLLRLAIEPRCSCFLAVDCELLLFLLFLS